jgi:ubiquinone/menaquinone biosynthesis C-methylase UbiE
LDQAAEIAIGTVVSHLKGETSVKRAVFVLFNQETLAAYQQALDKVLGKLTDKRPIAAGKSSFDLVDKEKVLAELNLQKGTVLLDVASGAGNYALEIANAMPEGGKIYAVDLWREGIDDLKRRAAERGLTSIRAVVADVSKEIPLRDHSVDVCFVATALHDLAEDNTAEGALKEMARVLKPGGNLVVIEFKKIEGPGPPLRIRLSPKELDALVLPFGFKSHHMVDVGAYTYLTVYTANKS